MSNLLSGHGLCREGRALLGDGSFAWRGGVTGPGMCSCGERSPILASDSARKAWHREHKRQVRTSQQED